MTSSSFRFAWPALLAFALLECGGGNTAGGDGGDAGDAASVPCAANTHFCHNGAYYSCDANGHGTLLQTCTDAMPACVDNVGCVVCQGGTHRCEPGNVNVPQVCRADNSGYDNLAACDPAQNQTCSNGMCLDPCGAAAAEHSYIGCEYWPVSTKNTCLAELGGTFPFAIAVANPQTSPVNVTITGGALTAPMNQSIPPGMLQTIQLPFVDDLAQLRIRPGTSVLHPGGAYHVVASAPVTVYQFNPLTFQMGTNYSYSNDASLLLPTPVLGSRYTALLWPGITFMIGNTPPWESGGLLTVVGTAANTDVTVTLAGSTFAGTGVTAGAMGDVQHYTLGAGDVLELLGHGQGTDLTGSFVQSSAPVAVFTGHGCAQVPVDRAAGNHLEEQSFPDQSWGNHYAVSAFIDRPGIPSVVRVIAQQDGTTLSFDPPSAAPMTTSLGARQFVEFEAMNDFVVTANKPILVAQFMYGGGLDSGVSDPAMVYEIPVEQYRLQYTFLAPDTFTHSFVNIVSPTDSPPSLDDAAFPGTPVAIGTSGMSVWAAEITPGVHRASAGSTPFGIKVYGTAEFTAYAYPGGLDLQVIVPQ